MEHTRPLCEAKLDALDMQCIAFLAEGAMIKVGQNAG